MARPEYKVEGYGVVTPEYDGKYLDGAHFDPHEQFASGGKSKPRKKVAKKAAKKTVAKKAPAKKATAKKK